MMQYITEHALILIPVLNILGMIIKGFHKIPDKYIPIILLFFGITGAVAIMGLNAQAAIQGVLITGTAVYGNQVFKQLKKKE